MCGLLLAVIVSVTNHAGRVVSGNLTSVANDKFVLSGRTYPLSILPKSEQDRLGRAFSPLGTVEAGRVGSANPPPTAREKRLRAAIQRDLDRARVRYGAGEMSAEAWAAKQAEAAAALSFMKSNPGN